MSDETLSEEEQAEEQSEQPDLRGKRPHLDALHLVGEVRVNAAISMLLHGHIKPRA